MKNHSTSLSGPWLSSTKSIGKVKLCIFPFMSESILLCYFDFVVVLHVSLSFVYVSWIKRWCLCLCCLILLVIVLCLWLCLYRSLLIQQMMYPDKYIDKFLWLFVSFFDSIDYVSLCTLKCLSICLLILLLSESFLSWFRFLCFLFRRTDQETWSCFKEEDCGVDGSRDNGYFRFDIYHWYVRCF